MPAPIYDIGARVDPMGEGMSSFSPCWVVLVVQQKYPLTYDRVAGRSRSADGTESAAERGVLIISDATSVQVQGDKDSHVGSATVTLRLGGCDYMSQIQPGDWICIWMLDNRADGQALISKLKELTAKGGPAEATQILDALEETLGDGLESANEFLSGLKFVGQTVSRFFTAGVSELGTPETQFTVQCGSFKEFDSSVFWDPYLSRAIPELNTWIGFMGAAIDEFLSQDGTDVNKAIKMLLGILLGAGIPEQMGNPTGDVLARITTGASAGVGKAPFAYVVPATIGKILGRRGRSLESAVLAMMDLLVPCLGVQKYEAGSSGQNERGLWPSSFQDMQGTFSVTIPDLHGKSLWAVLATYLNPALNEMYTSLKAGPDGKILPTFVCRQLPFSSPLGPTDKPTTSHWENVRWRAPKHMIKTVHVGSSDALRINFVHLTGFSQAQVNFGNITAQLVNPRSAPRRDAQDIQRGGLRADVQQIACGISDTLLGPVGWVPLRADWVMGQHLSWTGTINTYGIQEPIAHGDNFEFGGVLYHIQAVTHTGAMINNVAQFMTTLVLSHGMRADADTLDVETLALNQLKLYPGMEAGRELADLRFGSTSETQDTNKEVNPDPSASAAENPDSALILDQADPGRA